MLDLRSPVEVMAHRDQDTGGEHAARPATHLYGPAEMMSPSMMRRIRQIARLSTLAAALSAIVIVTYGDWPDAVIVGLTGVLTLSIARSVSWMLRQYNSNSHEV